MRGKVGQTVAHGGTSHRQEQEPQKERETKGDKAPHI